MSVKWCCGCERYNDISLWGEGTKPPGYRIGKTSREGKIHW